MAKGKPYLATWASNVLSLWRMDSSNVFQPVANVALATGFDLSSVLFSLAAGFTDDSRFLGVVVRTAVSLTEIRTYSTTALSLVQNVSLSNNSGAICNFVTRKKGLMSAMGNGSISLRVRQVNPSTGQVVNRGTLPSVAATPNYAEPAVHPSLEYILRPLSNRGAGTGLYIWYNNQVPGNSSYPNFAGTDTGAGTPTIQSVAAAWSADGDLMYFLDTGGEIQVVPFTKPAINNPDASQVIAAVGPIVSTVPSNGLGTSEGSRIFCDRSGSFVAVVHYNGTTYTTVIYQRVGSTLTEIQRIASFGKAGAFTEDSRFIVDANSKKAYELNLTSGLYEDVSATVMVNVPVSPFGFLSNDIDAVEGIADIYNVALGEFLSCGVDLANLKMVFLSSSASFNVSATTIAQAIDGFAVSDPNVPATGLTLQNVTLTPESGGQVVLRADDLAVNVANNFTFRYSALVDATNDTPIAFFDWGEDLTIDALSGVNIDLSSRGIVLFGV
nr:MAG TPA: hypothetical protein [Caudoviricetes sp.]